MLNLGIDSVELQHVPKSFFSFFSDNHNRYVHICKWFTKCTNEVDGILINSSHQLIFWDFYSFSRFNVRYNKAPRETLVIHYQCSFF